MKNNLKLYLDLIDKERNIYEKASLHQQQRKKIDTYYNILQDPKDRSNLKLKDNYLISETSKFQIKLNVPNFTKNDILSEKWESLNKQFLNYHKSLSVYSLINSAPILNFVSLDSKIGNLKNVKVLDVGGGTGHTHVSFFRHPESIEYFLLDPNLRLLHDQFIRIYPKLSYLDMGHILANAESLPIKNESFDVVLSLSAIDHLDDYKKFISESYRVLKKKGRFLIYSHLDKVISKKDKTTINEKLFSSTFFERTARFRYLKNHSVGKDDHTLHLNNTGPIIETMSKTGFKILKEKVFKRYFYILGEK